MDLDQIEDFIRRAIAAGVTVVLVVLGPITGQAVPGAPLPSAPPAGSTTPAPPPDRGTDDPVVPTTAPGADPDERDRTPSYPAGQDAAAATPPPDRADEADEVITAAEALGWGAPTIEDDFTAGPGAAWRVYDGGTGFDGRGRRSADAVDAEDGVLTITGTGTGTTGGLCLADGQRYGRWEVRMRAPESDPTYDAVLLLWPDSDDPASGEIDFVELQDPTRRTAEAWVHPGTGEELDAGRVEVDATGWHAWAVDWGPDAVTGYVDGQEWFRVTGADAVPAGSMHLCAQLDWFPGAGDAEVEESRVEVDWVRQYPADP